jgi:hypothetical protein
MSTTLLTTVSSAATNENKWDKKSIPLTVNQPVISSTANSLSESLGTSVLLIQFKHILKGRLNQKNLLL